MLPHSNATEEAVIGTLLQFSSKAEEFLDFLKPEYFHKVSHQHIIRACIELALNRRQTDLISVHEILQSKKVEHLVEGLHGLMILSEKAYPESLKDFFTELVKYHQLRMILETALNTANKCRRADIKDVNEVIEGYVESCHKLSIDCSKEIVMSFSEAARLTLAEIEYDNENKIEFDGIPSGFKYLDKRLNGFKNGETTIIAGRPAMGKTAFALQLFRNAYLATQRPVLFFSLEMTRAQLLKRMFAFEAKIEGNLFSTSKLKVEHFQKLLPAVLRVSDSKMFICEKENLTISEIASQSRKLKKEQGDLGIIVIDYLQLIAPEDSKANNREREIAQISMGLKSLAKELNCPVLCLSQLNRGVENRPDKRPHSADLRDSGSIEQDAAVIMMLYRDEVYKPSESLEKGIAQVILTKNRFGSVGTERLVFRAEYPAFYDIPEADLIRW